MNNSYWASLNKNNNLHWKGYSNKDRNTAIYEIEDIINKFGFILDFHMFSDMELSLKIEIEERKIFKLYNELKKYVLLNDYEDLNSESDIEQIIYFYITFTQGTGNLKIELPAVPG